MIGYCPLASGSRGNSIYVGTARTKILVDAGINDKTTVERLAALGVDIGEIDAIIITHEHIDHIAGLKKLALSRRIPILANAETAKAIVTHLGEVPRFKIFTTGEDFTVGDITIHPFTIQHDTVDPVAFTLRFDGTKIGICTDLGFPTTLVQHHLQDCDYLYVEANHDPDMVHASPRPMFLKQRILGRSGHLSNSECGQLLAKVVTARLKHIHLAHLSGECNAPVKAIATVSDALAPTGFSIPIDIAPQHTLGSRILF